MKHEDFKGHLPRYLDGALSEPEKGLFEIHYADCPHCDRMIHQAIDERELIARYAKNKLSTGEKEFLERHYFSCPACLEAVQETEALVDALRSAAPEKKQPQPAGKLFERLQESLIRLSAKPLMPAYALAVFLLLLVYPAWRGLFELPRVERDLSRSQKPQANSQVHMLLPMKGLQEELAQIIQIPPAQQAALPIILQFTLPDKAAEDSRYRAAIADQNGKIIWEEKELRSSGEYEVYAITCPSSFFSPGRLQLKVYEVERRGEKVLQEFVFPFEVARSPQ